MTDPSAPAAAPSPHRPRVAWRYRLGRGGWACFLLIPYLALAALFSQVNLLFWVFGLMFGAWFASALLARFMLAGLDLHRLSPDAAVAGRPARAMYRLTNRRRWLPCLGLRITELDGQACPAIAGPFWGWLSYLPAGSTLTAAALCLPRRRGPVPLDRIEVATAFPMGMLTRRIVFRQPQQMVVYPPIHRLKSDNFRLLHGDACAVAASSIRPGIGGDEFFGLREYRHGDRTALIDWKRSARADRLLSRDMARPTRPALMILLDLRRARQDPDAADHAIGFAASILTQARRQGWETGLVIKGLDAPIWRPHRTSTHLHRMLYCLGMLELTATDPSRHAALPRCPARWVVIHAGPVDPSCGPREAVHLSHLDLNTWRLNDPTPSEVRTP